MKTLIQDLQNPMNLPDATGGVEVLETHISVVLVADEHVYKIKKPVDFGFLDFSTPEKRHHYCLKELELNSRLSKDIYLDVLPVRKDQDHHTLNSTKGHVVEWALRMKRIPEQNLMKFLFFRNEISDQHLQKLSKKLSEFHLTSSKSEEINSFGKPETFCVNTDENFAQTEKYVGVTLSNTQFHTIEQWTKRFYNLHEALFTRRIEEGRIRDCHGDLHMEHVCLTDKIAIFDCIEFNDRFRYSDTLADIAFLLMDLEYHGGFSLARDLWGHYKLLAGEGDAGELLTFYKVYRAYVRGKVSSFQLDDPELDGETRKRIAEKAGRYFDLAYAYTVNDGEGIR